MKKSTDSPICEQRLEKAIEPLGESAPGDIRMRYAQTIGLITAAICGGARFIDGHPKAIMIHGSLGYLSFRQGSNIDAFRTALENEDSP